MKGTLKESVVEELREAIIKGDFQPGAQIRQASVAREIETSRGTLREALGVLEKEGLVINMPYQGTFVTDFNENVLEECVGIRQVLDKYASEKAAKHGTLKQKCELHYILQKMIEAVKKHSMDDFYEADLEFHRQIYLMSDNNLLFEMWKYMESTVRRGIYLSSTRNRIHKPDKVIRMHEEIYNAIQNEDPKKASRHAEVHIMQSSLYHHE